MREDGVVCVVKSFSERVGGTLALYHPSAFSIMHEKQCRVRKLVLDREVVSWPIVAKTKSGSPGRLIE